MSLELHGRQDERLKPEKVAYWYLRLNGFLQIENFVLHRTQGGGQRTDADLLAVRFPHRSEFVFDYPNDPMQDDFTSLELSRDQIDICIVEVKGNQPCTLNGPWTRKDKKNIHRVLSAIGCLPPPDLERAAADLYAHGMHTSEAGLRIRLLAIGVGPNPQLAADHPGALQLVWSDILTFMWDRFNKYRREKADVAQWGASGLAIKSLADQSDDAAGFVREALRRMW